MSTNNRIIFFAVIALIVVLSSIALAFVIPASARSNHVNANQITPPANAVDTSVTVYVVRLYQGQIAQDSYVQVVDSQTLPKYLVLQNLMKEADTKYEKLLTTNNFGPGQAPSIPVQTPSAAIQVNTEVARAIANDSSLNFHKDSENNYLTMIKTGNAIYAIQISGS